MILRATTKLDRKIEYLKPHTYNENIYSMYFVCSLSAFSVQFHFQNKMTACGIFKTK